MTAASLRYSWARYGNSNRAATRRSSPSRTGRGIGLIGPLQAHGRVIVPDGKVRRRDHVRDPGFGAGIA